MKTRIFFTAILPMSIFFFLSCSEKNLDLDKNAPNSLSEGKQDDVLDAMGFLNQLQSLYGESNTVILKAFKDKNGEMELQFSLEDKVVPEDRSFIPRGQTLTNCRGDLNCAEEAKECLDDGGTLTARKNADGSYYMSCK